MKRMIGVVALVALAAGGCSKESKPESAPSGPPTAGDPHAGAPSAAKASEPAGGTPDPHDPHGAVANPHGAGDPHATAGGADLHAAGNPGGAEPTAEDGTKAFTPFTLKVPKGWKESAPTSGMRAAQFAIPGDGGADAELVIYYFGNAGAGGVEANLDRWYGQFTQVDGSATKDKAVRKESKMDGFDVTTVKAQGTYVASKSPGSPESYNEPGWAMLGAIVQSEAGPYYFKMVGPEKAIAKAEKPFGAMINSIKKRK
jgi:hypothetical protein